MLLQENPAGGLSVGGMLPRYSAGSPEGARPHEPARRSSVAGMPRDPAVGVALGGHAVPALWWHAAQFSRRASVMQSEACCLK